MSRTAGTMAASLAALGGGGAMMMSSVELGRGEATSLVETGKGGLMPSALMGGRAMPLAKPAGGTMPSVKPAGGHETARLEGSGNQHACWLGCESGCWGKQLENILHFY